MKALYCDTYPLPVPARHRFPQDKYSRLRERLSAQNLVKLDFIESPKIALADVALAHDCAYIRRAIAGQFSAEEQRLLGFPWSFALVERALHSAGGTLAACRAALHEGVAVNLAGGTHHAKRHSGAGYCLFNDVAIAVLALSLRGDIQRVLVVDADVHQGDGTAEILGDYPQLYTFSIHADGNFPINKATSNLDVAIPDGMGDSGYLRNFRDGVSRAFVAARPQLVIYLAGADPYKEDRLGRLTLSKKGLGARDELLIDRCRRGNVPLAVVMAGGYAPNVDDIVDIHYQTVMLASSYAGCFVQS
ncbi:MAG: acetoin utilization deacetylase AcuC-like enzyme [Gammaproteobacteria bacterium]|jgi:acetoin utilization deacetylase AcuC-like enzyme